MGLWKKGNFVKVGKSPSGRETFFRARLHLAVATAFSKPPVFVQQRKKEMLSNTKVIFYYVLLSFKRTKDIFRKPIEIELAKAEQHIFLVAVYFIQIQAIVGTFFILRLEFIGRQEGKGELLSGIAKTTKVVRKETIALQLNQQQQPLSNSTVVVARRLRRGNSNSVAASHVREASSPGERKRASRVLQRELRIDNLFATVVVLLLWLQLPLNELSQATTVEASAVHTTTRPTLYRCAHSRSQKWWRRRKRSRSFKSKRNSSSSVPSCATPFPQLLTHISILYPYSLKSL